MKRDRKAQVATVLLMVALGGVALWKQGAFDRVAPSKAAAAEPRDAIYESLDAVREGNLARFIDGHTGEMESSLRRASREVGDARLLESIQAKNALVKGVAIQEPERISDREVKARVEYVFADRNEVQIVYLERVGERWKIARADGAQRIETLIPYGTPVK